MKTIWKQKLESGEQTITLPARAEVLSVQTQRNDICFWFLCDPAAPKVERKFEVFETGGAVPEGKRTFLGTVSLPFLHSTLYFHVFERTS